VLLSKESQLGYDLVGPLRGRGEPALELDVLLLGGRKSLVGEQVSRPVRRFEGLQAALGPERSPTKAG
jgi:hypothetical protein